MPRRDIYRTNTGLHIEWFTVRRSTVWAVILIPLFVAGIAYFIYWDVNNQRGLGASILADDISDNSARFLALKGNVKVRQAGTFEFVDANRAMKLTTGDMIRTVGTASARVQLFDGTEYLVKPESILVIEEAFEDPTTKITRTGVKLTSGQVNLTTPPRAEPGSSSELTTDIGRADIEEDTTMDVSYEPSSRQAGFQVLRGMTSLSTTGGRKMTLKGEQAVDVSASGFSDVIQLPGVPLIDHPGNFSVVGTDAPLEFRWRAVSNARRYKVQIDRTPNFWDPIVDSNIVETSLLQKSLAVGTYYWRVSAVDRRGNSGAPSHLAKFTVSSRGSDLTASGPAPELSVFPPNVTLDGVVTIRGRAPSSALVTVNVGEGDERITVKDNGSFAHYFTARRAGRHTVVVRARGREGGEVATKTVYADVGTGR